MIRLACCNPGFERFLACAVWMFVCTVVPGPSTRSLAEEAPAIRQIFVPAADPASWPRGDWRPLSREEYESLRKLGQPRPAVPTEVRIERAEYDAVFATDVLRDGTLTASISGKPAKAELIRLEPLNLAVAQLSWSDGDAVWGSTPGGEPALLVDRESGDLQGRWSLRGRGLPLHSEFDVRLLPASISRLRIRLPEDRFLKSSVGDVRGPLDCETAGWKLWHVDLGSQTVCRLTVGQVRGERSGRPLAIYEQNTSYVVRQADLQFQTDLNVEVLESPLQTLEVLLPAEADVYSVTYGGEAALTWTQSPPASGSTRQVTIQLADPLLGKGRTIRIRGATPVTLDEPWRLPRIGVRGGLFAAGRLAVQVPPPLRLRDFDARGCRQASTDADAVQGETLTFDQFTADATLDVNVGYPGLALSSRVLTYVDTNAENWNMVCEMQWTARSGATFTAECSLPGDWEIADVRKQTSTGSADLADWNVEQHSDGRHTLRLQFKESLNPASPKTLVILARRLPVPANQQTSVPAIEPLHCDDFESLLALKHVPAATLVLDPASSFEAVAKDSQADNWVGFALWQQVVTEDDPVDLLLRSNPQQAAGMLRLQVTQQLVDVLAAVHVNVDRDGFSERHVLRCNPSSGPLKRLLVYLTSAGPTPQWEFLGGNMQPLEARQLLKSRHEEWGVPPGGELWELSFAEPQTQPFRLGMSRTRTAGFASLSFVPSSREFRGTILLQTSPGVDVDVKTSGVQPLDPGSRLLEVADSFSAADRRFSWSYRTARDTLEFRIVAGGASARKQSLATVEIESLLLSQTGGHEVHWARFHLDRHTSHGEFHFRLPAPAELIAVTVNEQRVIPTRSGDEFVVPSASQDEMTLVGIQYRTPSAPVFVRGLRTVVMPQVDVTVLRCDWNVATPPQSRLVSMLGGAYSGRATDKASWSELLFGPLGRSSEGEIFNVFDADSWREFVRPVSEIRPSAIAAGDRFFVPPMWSLHQATVPQLPLSLSVELANAGRVRLLAWCSLFVCLSVGVSLRILQARCRGRVGAYWLSLCVAAMWLVPAPFAEIVGGAFLGGVISILLPRAILRAFRLTPPPGGEPLLSGGSTATISRAAVGLSLMAGVLHSAAVGQGPSVAAESPSNRSETEVRRLDVLIPVASVAAPSLENVPIVYVTPELLTRFRQLRTAGETADPQYLISSVEYRGVIADAAAPTLSATMKVVVLRESSTVRVSLPFSNPNFDAARPCRVDGKPHPLLRSPSGEFYLELDVDAQRALPANVQIELLLHPPATVISGGGTFELGVPRVAASSLSLEFPTAVPTVEVADAQGELVVAAASHTAAAWLGSASRLKVLWSTQEVAVEEPAAYDARVSVFVDLQPAWLQYRLRVAHKIAAGSLSFVTWQLPRDAIIRDVVSAQPVTVLKSSNGGEQSTWTVQFADPLSTDFAIEAVVLVPLATGSERIELPQLDLLAADRRFKPARPSPTVLGVSPSTGMQLEPLSSESEEIKTIDPHLFAAAWGNGESVRRPQVAYQLAAPATLEFKLSALTPKRKVRQTETARISRGEIEWTLTAEIETTTAPALRHILNVPAGVQVESVSVQEDQAERLVRWSRVANRLVLFLGAKTTGIQSVSVKASLPLAPAASMSLPSLRVEGSELVDARLVVHFDSAVNVVLLNADQVTQYEAAGDAAADANGQQLLGRFRLDGGSPLPSIRVDRRAAVSAVDLATFLQQRPDHRWLLSTTVRVQEPAGVRSALVLDIPAELSPALQLKPADLLHRTEQLPGGNLKLTIEPSADGGMPASFTVTSELPAADEAAWTLPEPLLADAVNRYLAVSPRGAVQPVEAGAAAIEPAAWPSWLDELPELTSVEDVAVYRATSRQPWTLQSSRPPADVAQPEIPLIDHRLWVDGEGNSVLRTRVYLVAPRDRQLELDWQPDNQLQAVFVDGIPLSAIPDSTPVLAVPIAAGSRTHTVTLFWTRRPGHSARWFGSSIDELPVPRNIACSRVLAAASLARPARRLYASGIEDESAIDFAFAHAEGLVETCRRSLELDGTLDPSLWKELSQADASLAELMAPGGDATSTTAATRRKRHVDIQAAMQEFRNAQPELGADAELPGPFRNLVEESAFAALPQIDDNILFGQAAAQAGPPSVALWYVDRAIPAIAGALLLLAGAVPIFRRLVRLEFGDWLAAWPALSWGALGLIWWLWLVPSVLGIALLLLGAATAVRPLVRRLNMQPAHSAGPSAS